MLVELGLGGQVLRTHPSATTAPANTVPSPTPAVGPAASTRPNPRGCGTQVPEPFRNVGTGT